MRKYRAFIAARGAGKDESPNGGANQGTGTKGAKTYTIVLTQACTVVKICTEAE